MDPIFKYLVVFIKFVTLFDLVISDTYSVKVGTEQHVNSVDSKFLSFTVDLKLLLSSSEKHNNRHCVCMASSLTPAYIRIAGPSTSHMKFRNSTITIDDATPLVKEDPEKIALSLLTGRKDRRLSIINKQWQKFVHWAKNTGFDVVFALNNAEKTSSGMWDPNGALNILSVAEKANIGDIVWQLGYECTNQSIEEYLNDLETLRVIVETFPPGRSPSWRVVGGDVTPCLQADSKSDFKDYISLSNDMMDAILLNGNSSAQQLEKMSESDRRKLLKLLSHSDTPLWLTEKTQSHYDELERAAEWLASLGYSARNGFSMHFRELLEDELHEPTLSFYMALLYKNLVGERVLDVDMTVSRATLFAHCASLRRKPVPGAVTLYGANMDDEPARFSLKLSKREEGGDIMQFIFGRDSSGNIIVNGRAMYLEGDIRPVVKRVRPYKTLLLNLPPKSFGFWVLANTQVDACHYKDESKMETEFIEAIPIEDDDTEEIMNVVKRRRSSIRKRDVNNLDMSFEIIDDDYTGVLSSLDVESKNDALRRQIDSLNNELKNFHELVISKKGQKNDQFPMRFKRQAVDRENRKQSINYGTKSRRSKQMYEKSDFKSNLIDKILQLKNEKLAKLGKGRFSRKNFKRSNTKACSDEDYVTNEEKVSRKRRSVIKEKTLDSLENAMRSKNIKHRMNNVKSIEETSENEIDISEDQFGVGNILHKLKGTLRHLPIEIEENIEKVDDGKEELSSNTNEITLKTKLSDDGAVINISEKTNNGLLKSTYEDLLSLLTDLNKHLNRFWSTFTLLE